MRTLLPSILLLVICIGSASAQAPSPSPQPSSASSEISLQQYREILEHERQLMEQQSEKYYARIDSLINRTLSVLGVIAAVALGLFVWQFGKTRKELKDTVHEQFQSQVASLIDSDMKTLKESVGSEITVLNASVQSLRTQVEELQAYQNQRIVWVFSGTEMNAQQELDALHASGLQKIKIFTPPNANELEMGEPDLVIFSFNGTDEGRRRLEKIVTNLQTKSPPVSLLIYTYNPEGNEIRLGESERRILQNFLWSVPVNFPTTLLAQTQLLIRTRRRV
jgi:hypothetical protein